MKTFLILIAALSASSALALPVPHSTVEFRLNNSSSAGPGVQLGTRLVRETKHVMRARYDYSVQGGSDVGSITLKDVNGGNATLPDGAIITNVIFDVLTAPTSSGSATLAFTAQSAADLKAATAYGSFSGLVAGIPVGTAASSIKLTASRTLSMAIAAATLTAGKIDVIIEYHLVE